VKEASANGMVLFDRTFLSSETKEIRLYMDDGEDHIAIDGTTDLPIKLRIVTGEGDDKVRDQTSGEMVYVYNKDGSDDTELGRHAFETDNVYLMQDSIQTAKLKFNDRDWGKGWLPMPALDLQSDIGLLLGGSLSFYRYGFGEQKCRTCISLEALAALKVSEWSSALHIDRLIAPNGTFLTSSVSLHTGVPVRFHGFGNDLEPAPSETPFTGFRRTVDASAGLRYKPADTWHLSGGVAFKRSGIIREGGDIFETLDYGSGSFQQAGLTTTLDVDTRDSRHLPTRGADVVLRADYYPSMLDVESPFGSVRGVVRLYQGLPLPLDPAIHLRFVGETVWGDAPFGEIPWLGGSSTLPGFARGQFRGESMASGAALLRLKAFSLFKLDFGVHGLAGVGRVWLDGEDSDTWHSTTGGGGWIHVPLINKTISVTLANGSKQRMYVDFGFIF
jgi:hypothetical protein